MVTKISYCPTSLPFPRMGSGFPLPSGVYTLAEVTRCRREQQYIDDNLFNHKSRAAMMVNVATAMMQQRQVGADHRSQRLSSLLHSGRTRTPGSDVRYFCSRLHAVKLKNSAR